MIPTKSEKFRSVLVDSLRILAWSHFKIVNSVAGLDAYVNFDEQWRSHPIHHQSYEEIIALTESLGYTQDELLEWRREYYSHRKSQ